MVGTRGTRSEPGVSSRRKNLGGFGDAVALFTTTRPVNVAGAPSQIDRVHGMEPKYYHQQVGVNSRLDALQAAVLAVKLRHLETWHQRRQNNADFYNSAFKAAGAQTTDVPISDGGFPLRTPYAHPTPARHIYNQYIIRVPAEMRDDLRAHLTEHRIGTEIYYPVPLHMQECFADLGYAPEDLPESLLASQETVALPIYPGSHQAATAACLRHHRRMDRRKKHCQHLISGKQPDQDTESAISSQDCVLSDDGSGLVLIMGLADAQSP